jgi:hypothetical protein
LVLWAIVKEQVMQPSSEFDRFLNRLIRAEVSDAQINKIGNATTRPKMLRVLKNELRNNKELNKQVQQVYQQWRLHGGMVGPGEPSGLNKRLPAGKGKPIKGKPMAKQMTLFGGNTPNYPIESRWDYEANWESAQSEPSSRRGRGPYPGSKRQPLLPIVGKARHVPGQGGPVYSPTNPRNKPPNLALYKGGFNPNAPMPRSGVNLNPAPNLAVVNNTTLQSAAKTLPKEASKTLLKSVGKMAIFGRLMGWGMIAMTAWMVMEAMGLTGKKGKADKETIAALDVIGSQWAQKEAASGEFLKVRKGSEQMQQFADFAEEKQRGQRDMNLAMSGELDSLLGGKASLLSKASLAQPQTQQIIQSFGGQI